MSQKLKLSAFLFCCLFCSSAFSQITALEFLDDFKEAKVLAKEQGKHVLVYVHAEYCDDCEHMERHVFNRQDARIYFSKRYVLVKLHFNKSGKWFVWKHKVKSYPSFLFFDEDGKELHRTRGFRDQEQFIQAAEVSYRNPKAQLKKYEKEYRKQKNDPAFLLEYLAFAEDVRNNRLIDQLVDEIIKKRDKVDESVWMDLVLDYVYKEKSKLFNALTEDKESFYEVYGEHEIKKLIIDIIVDSEFNKINYNVLDKLILKCKEKLNKHKVKTSKDELFPAIADRLTNIYLPSKNYNSLAELYYLMLVDYSEKVERDHTIYMISFMLSQRKDIASWQLAEKIVNKLLEENSDSRLIQLKKVIEDKKT